MISNSKGWIYCLKCGRQVRVRESNSWICVKSEGGCGTAIINWYTGIIRLALEDRKQQDVPRGTLIILNE